YLSPSLMTSNVRTAYQITCPRFDYMECRSGSVTVSIDRPCGYLWLVTDGKRFLVHGCRQDRLTKVWQPTDLWAAPFSSLRADDQSIGVSLSQPAMPDYGVVSAM